MHSAQSRYGGGVGTGLLSTGGERVMDLTLTTGTGNYTLEGIATTGLRRFYYGTNVQSPAYNLYERDFYYHCTDRTDWEVGRGQMTNFNTVVRETILASSNAGAAVNWGAGAKTIMVSLSSGCGRMPYSGASYTNVRSVSTTTPITEADAGGLIITTGSSETVIQIPGSDSFPFPYGATVTIFQKGTGKFLVSGASASSTQGVELRGLIENRGQYYSISLTKCMYLPHRSRGSTVSSSNITFSPDPWLAVGGV